MDGGRKCDSSYLHRTAVCDEMYFIITPGGDRTYIEAIAHFFVGRDKPEISPTASKLKIMDRIDDHCKGVCN